MAAVSRNVMRDSHADDEGELTFEALSGNRRTKAATYPVCHDLTSLLDVHLLSVPAQTVLFSSVFRSSIPMGGIGAVFLVLGRAAHFSCYVSAVLPILEGTF
jgi:hypothetical protein